ncbi:Endonuclease/exonuclease/phosphatase [Rhodocollybia butyracea]|uniref:Endonuclease/exonuclease/phosphatase n=1 Tax=Rhodocollybia butyracea TaxID=206335 RepID=A0A9P5U7S2_9AGAR|nr:Endonuclease/exonuclease/phosphatase [Rhodocollybia butyracea]
MASKRLVLTPEQIAISEARKAKKAAQATQTVPTVASLVNEEKGRIVERKWIQIKDTTDAASGHRVKILTWNLLAQCLVRRELFPNSDCLKATQREHMLYRELLLQNADIMCLQEVDRLDKLLPVLESAGYKYNYAAGPKKKHGCLIAFKGYEEINSKMVIYDDQQVRYSDGVSSKGGSFRTKNIGHIVALKLPDSDQGFIVATTHLFWHPKYLYERARQTVILKREVIQFKKAVGHENWPCIISGDFNFTPDDPVYSLMIGDTVLSEQEEKLRPSYVVHKSLDFTIVAGASSNDENEEEGVDPDKVITNARAARPTDGLLSLSELKEIFSQSGSPLKSAYDSGLQVYLQSWSSDQDKPRTFGDRVPISPSRKGRYEPEWTNYTFYWKLVLDYIFILDAPGGQSTISGLLSGHRTADIHPGLPQLGVCGSDHVSLCAEIIFTYP